MAGSRKQSRSKKRKHKRERRWTRRALILIDEKPIRRRAINKCTYILKQFDSVMHDLDRFDRIDGPAFRQWMHASFGRQLTDLRELQEEVHHIADLLDHIEYLHLWKNMSYYKAYVLAKEMRDHPERYSGPQEESEREAPEQEEPEQEDPEQEDEFDDPDSQALSEEELLDLFQVMIGGAAELAGLHPDSAEYQTLYVMFRAFMASDHDEDDDEDLYEDIFGDEDNETGGETVSEERLKAIYRFLAKKLHPDNRGSANASLDELWYRVQDAYQRGDLEELQILQAGYEVRNTKGFAGLPISRILAVHEDHKEQLRLLRHRHRELKTDIAWCFTDTSDREMKQLHTSYARTIVHETAEAQAHKTHLEAKLLMYSTPPSAKRSTKKKRYVSKEKLSLFDF